MNIVETSSAERHNIYRDSTYLKFCIDIIDCTESTIHHWHSIAYTVAPFLHVNIYQSFLFEAN